MSQCNYRRPWYSHITRRRYAIRCANPADPETGLCAGPHSCGAARDSGGEPVPVDCRSEVSILYDPTPLPDYDARRADILARVEARETYTSIAASWGISRQRVGQIFCRK